jgi:ribosomal protein RSM22 (predicted rRNA methylase)
VDSAPGTPGTPDEPGHPGDELIDALEAAAAPAGVGRLAPAWAELSAGYREGRPTPAGAGLTADHARAYAAGRAPATYAAVGAVLAEVASRRPGWAPASLLDLGAGPGVATWAAAQAFPSLAAATLVERSPVMIDEGRALAAAASAPLVRSGRWVEGDATRPRDRADLVVAAYLLSELDERRLDAAVAAWWAAAGAELVIVDAGTPAGFARVRASRAALVAAGATLTAPCPDDGPCPMVGRDWCHFTVRLRRPGLLRGLKGADLGHEDEKFSYVAASRDTPAHAAARVLRHPQARTGHVRFRICRGGEARTLVVPKSRRAAYRWARDARWGDAVPPDALADG